MTRRWSSEHSVPLKATLHWRSPNLCYVDSQDVCTYLSPPGSPPQTLGAIGIGSLSPREHSLCPSFPSPRKQPHHPSFSAPEGPATLSCHLPPYMNTEHAQSWPSINVSTGNYRRTLLVNNTAEADRACSQVSVWSAQGRFVLWRTTLCSLFPNYIMTRCQRWWWNIAVKVGKVEADVD